MPPGTLSECQKVWIKISCSGSKEFAKIISRQQKTTLARKELKAEVELDNKREEN